MADFRLPACLGDYVDLQRGNTYKGSLLGEAGPVLLGLASIARNGGFRSDNLKTYGGHSDPRMLLESGDIYVSLKDVTQSADLLGAVSRVPDSIHQGRLTQDTVKLVFKTDDAPKDYIYWLLRTPLYREYCRAHATGTTNLGLSREDFLAFPVPPLIASRTELVPLLQALEDKIDLNRRMNKTLESIARATFVNRSLDWPETTLGELAEIYDGPHATPKKTDDGPIFLGISNLSSGQLDLADVERLSEEDFVRWTRRVTPMSGDIVFSYETRLGQCARIPDGLRCCLGRRMGLLRSKADKVHSELLLHAFLSNQFQETVRQRTVHGSTVERLLLTEMGSFPIRMINVDEQNETLFLLRPLWLRIDHNQEETRTLSDLRDLLLPKLMSGEIRVRDAEKLVEAAA